jgi:hypothetical protein
MWNPDSTIALSEDGGERWVVRREVEANDPTKESGGFLEGVDGNVIALSGSDGSSVADGGWLRAVWRPWKGTSVDTWLVPPHPSSPCWHVRIHRITRDIVRPGGETVLVSDAGFAIYAQGIDGRTLSLLPTTDASALQNQYGKIEGSDFAVVRSAAGVSGIADLTSIFFPTSTNLSKPSKSVTNASNFSSLSSSQVAADSNTRKAQIIHLDSNANIVSSRSCMPSLIGEFSRKEGKDDVEDIWVATGIFAVPSKASARGAERKEAQTEGMELAGGVEWLKAWATRPGLECLPKQLKAKLSA